MHTSSGLIPFHRTLSPRDVPHETITDLADADITTRPPWYCWLLCKNYHRETGPVEESPRCPRKGGKYLVREVGLVKSAEVKHFLHLGTILWQQDAVCDIKVPAIFVMLSQFCCKWTWRWSDHWKENMHFCKNSQFGDYSQVFKYLNLFEFRCVWCVNKDSVIIHDGFWIKRVVKLLHFHSDVHAQMWSIIVNNTHMVCFPVMCEYMTNQFAPKFKHVKG